MGDPTMPKQRACCHWTSIFGDSARSGCSQGILIGFAQCVDLFQVMRAPTDQLPAVEDTNSGPSSCNGNYGLFAGCGLANWRPFPVLLTMRTDDELSEIAPASSLIRDCRREITKYIPTALLCWGAGILHRLGMLILAVDHERSTGRLKQNPESQQYHWSQRSGHMNRVGTRIRQEAQFLLVV